MHLITRRKAKLTCSLRMASLINHNSGWDSMEMPVKIRISVVENKSLCTFSSQDERMNFTGLSAHRTCTFPLKQKLQQLGEAGSYKQGQPQTTSSWNYPNLRSNSSSWFSGLWKMLGHQMS